jgi:hypothetical protein
MRYVYIAHSHYGSRVIVSDINFFMKYMIQLFRNNRVILFDIWF